MEENPKPKKWWNSELFIKVSGQATTELIKWIFTTLI
jgi:tRNA uridine 5-carbamoylmethylation protein Kti12